MTLRPPEDLVALATAKLASSGLTPVDAAALGIEVMNAEATFELVGVSAPALLLVYYDSVGERREDTCRARLLELPPPGPFGEVRKDLRYLQPSHAPPAAYFPKIVPWVEVSHDPERTVIITEGELKAACAAKAGFACLGLGGVASWRSRKRGWKLLPELEEFEWRERDVVIAFDSDAATKPQVSAELARLLEELTAR